MLPATGSVPLRGNCRSRDTAFSLCMDNSLPTRVAHRLPPFDRELLRRAITAHRAQRGDALEIVGHPGDLEPRAGDQGAAGPRPPAGPLRHGPRGRVPSVR